MSYRNDITLGEHTFFEDLIPLILNSEGGKQKECRRRKCIVHTDVDLRSQTHLAEVVLTSRILRLELAAVDSGQQ